MLVSDNSHRASRLVALVAVAVLVALAASGCARGADAGGPLTVAGAVRDDVIVVTAPVLDRPTPDVRAGIPAKRARSAAGAPAAARAATSRTGVAGTIVTVARAGDRVAAGGLVAQLDAGMLDLAVAAARTSRAKALADIRVIDGARDDLAAKRGDLRDARIKLDSALSKIRSARADLVTQLEQARRLAASPRPPAGGPSLDPRVLVARLSGALRALDAKYATALAARRKLTDAGAKLEDARAALADTRDLAAIVAEARNVTIDLALAQRERTRVASPVGGVVVWAPERGTVALAGSPLAKVRPAGDSFVDTYLTAEEVTRVRIGDRAEVGIDSLPRRTVRARIVAIGDAYVFPPTWFPTQVTHLSRAVRVTVAVDDGTRLPPGTPADVTFPEATGSR
ncbi:MAG: HlyD family efflux transporter periplasmic adaptor subunit [Coriobacteriia bacterium]